MRSKSFSSRDAIYHEILRKLVNSPDFDVILKSVEHLPLFAEHKQAKDTYIDIVKKPPIRLRACVTI